MYLFADELEKALNLNFITHEEAKEYYKKSIEFALTPTPFGQLTCSEEMKKEEV